MITMLPFLSQEKLLELYKKIKNSEEGSFNGITMVMIYPFLDQDNLNVIVDDMIETGKDIMMLVPFLNKERLSHVVDLYIAGNEKINVDTLIPFLSKEEIEKIFDDKMK